MSESGTVEVSSCIPSVPWTKLAEAVPSAAETESQISGFPGASSVKAVAGALAGQPLYWQSVVLPNTKISPNPRRAPLLLLDSPSRDGGFWGNHHPVTHVLWLPY